MFLHFNGLLGSYDQHIESLQLLDTGKVVKINSLSKYIAWGKSQNSTLCDSAQICTCNLWINSSIKSEVSGSGTGYFLGYSWSKFEISGNLSDISNFDQL